MSIPHPYGKVLAGTLNSAITVQYAFHTLALEPSLSVRLEAIKSPQYSVLPIAAPSTTLSFDCRIVRCVGKVGLGPFRTLSANLTLSFRSLKTSQRLPKALSSHREITGVS